MLLPSVLCQTYSARISAGPQPGSIEQIQTGPFGNGQTMKGKGTAKQPESRVIQGLSLQPAHSPCIPAAHARSVTVHRGPSREGRVQHLGPPPPACFSLQHLASPSPHDTCYSHRAGAVGLGAWRRLAEKRVKSWSAEQRPAQASRGVCRRTVPRAPPAWRPAVAQQHVAHTVPRQLKGKPGRRGAPPPALPRTAWQVSTAGAESEPRHLLA